MELHGPPAPEKLVAVIFTDLLTSDCFRPTIGSPPRCATRPGRSETCFDHHVLPRTTLCPRAGPVRPLLYRPAGTSRCRSTRQSIRAPRQSSTALPEPKPNVLPSNPPIPDFP